MFDYWYHLLWWSTSVWTTIEMFAMSHMLLYCVLSHVARESRVCRLKAVSCGGGTPVHCVSLTNSQSACTIITLTTTIAFVPVVNRYSNVHKTYNIIHFQSTLNAFETLVQLCIGHCRKLQCHKTRALPSNYAGNLVEQRYGCVLPLVYSDIYYCSIRRVY